MLNRCPDGRNFLTWKNATQLRSARATRSLDGLVLLSLDVVPLALEERLSDAAVELLALLRFASLLVLLRFVSLLMLLRFASLLVPLRLVSLLMLPRFASVVVLAGGGFALELGAGVLCVVLLLGLLP